jgi:hypothetical protein
MKHVLSSSTSVDRESLPRTLLAAGLMLLATVGACSAAQDAPANEPVSAPASAADVAVQETLRGTVAETNERNDRLTVQIASTGQSGDFKVRDGLLFNAVRYGDPVEITVETIGGVRTIVALKKE